MITSRKLWRLAAVLGLAVALVGCGGGGSTGGGSSDRREDPFVQFVNSVPDSGALDFFMNDTRFAPNIPYLQANNDFIQVPELVFNEDEGAYDIYARVVGQTEDLDRIVEVVQKETASVVVAFGLVNFGTEFEKRAQLLRQQIRRTPVTGNRARLVVLNGLVEEVGNRSPIIDFQTPGDNPVIRFRGIEYGKTNIPAVTEGQPLDPIVASGTYTFQAKRGDVDGDFIYTQTEVTLVPGRTYFVLVTGVQGASEPAQRPRIQFIQLSTRA